MKQWRWTLGCLLGAAVLLTGLTASRGYRPQAEARQEGRQPAKQNGTKGSGRLTPETARAEEKAIRKVLDAFSAAYNKGDLDGMLAVWTDDAEFIAESGKVSRGKAQLRLLLKKSLATSKGSKQSIKVRSIRFIKPDVAVEEGDVSLTSKDGATDSGPYESVWVKLNGRWLISRVRDLPDTADDDRPAAYHKLKPLAWMVGEWVGQEGKGDVKMSCRWGPGQTFLLQEVTVKQEGGKVLTISQRIGWDPVEEELRSWVFDSTGGYAQGVWTREGNTWVVDSEGVLPDGRVATATHRFKYLDDSKLNWSSTNRQADERPLPDVTVTLTKKKGS
jgi:uncharacterized protein (TIGR02246 family)